MCDRKGNWRRKGRNGRGRGKIFRWKERRERRMEKERD